MVYEHALRLGPAVLDKKRTGELVNIAVDGMDWIELFYGVYFVQFVVGMVTPIALCIYIGLVDWVVGVSLIVAIPLTPHVPRRAVQAVPQGQREVRRRQQPAERRLPRRPPGHDHAQDVQPGREARRRDVRGHRGAARDHHAPAVRQPGDDPAGGLRLRAGHHARADGRRTAADGRGLPDRRPGRGAHPGQRRVLQAAQPDRPVLLCRRHRPRVRQEDHRVPRREADGGRAADDAVAARHEGLGRDPLPRRGLQLSRHGKARGGPLLPRRARPARPWR